MSNTVEIGCGAWPGPRFDQTGNFFLVEPDERALANAARFNPDMIPMPDARGEKLPFANKSISLVLARDVFGDPHLGASTNSGAPLWLDQAAMLRRGEVEAFQESSANAVKEADELKLAILRETARVLEEQGRLIVVESRTPQIAARFFDGPFAEVSNEIGLQVQRTQLQEVAPSHYVEHHTGASFRIPDAWLGTTALQHAR